MPANIIPDQSANTNLMLDGQVLHGEAANGTPYIKDIFEDVVNNVNRLASESDVTPGAGNIGVKTAAFTNFTKATNDVEAALEGIDAALSTAGGGISAYQFYDKYIYNAKRNAVHQGVTAGTPVTVGEIRAYLGVDAGTQVDSMSSLTGWSGSNGDSAVTLYTADYFEGGACLSVSKSTNANASAGLQKTTFTATNLTNQKLRVSVKLPPVTGVGTFTGIRVTLGNAGFASNGIWNMSFDVGGKAMVANDNKYIVELSCNTPDIDSGYAGGGAILSTTCIKVEMLLSSTNSLVSNFLVDHIVVYPESAPPLNVNILKRDYATGEWFTIKQTADSYSFPGLTGGQMIILNTALENNILNDNDVLFIDIPTSGSYGGQDLFVMVKLQ
jgi:hypothetical protein